MARDDDIAGETRTGFHQTIANIGRIADIRFKQLRVRQALVRRQTLADMGLLFLIERSTDKAEAFGKRSDAINTDRRPRRFDQPGPGATG